MAPVIFDEKAKSLNLRLTQSPAPVKMVHQIEKVGFFLFHQKYNVAKLKKLRRNYAAT
jgi:hypothetical protein